MDYASFLTGAYKDQLGREPDAGGLQWYTEQLTSGAKSPEQVMAELNQSLEGQNYDTQMLTSEYRQAFGRDPEQAGYQYWMTRAQSDPALNAQIIESYIRGGATGADIAALAAAPKGYTELLTSALQADPWAGRRATESIYDVSGATNLSQMGNALANFVTPVTMQPIISQYDPTTQSFTTTAGADILDPNRVANAIQIARGSGALSEKDALALMGDLSKAQNMTDVYTALSKPQAGVVIDKIYGIQTGEDVNMAKARAEALDRQKVLDTFNYAPAYDTFGNALVKQGLANPFAAENYTAGTLARPQYVATPETFPGLLNKTIDQSFGYLNFVPTNVPQGFYSERGLESGFIPFGAENAPTFRSGVAGYTPNIPTGLQFGTSTVQAPINVFTPGQFNAEAIGYTPEGRPITEQTVTPGMTFYDAKGNPVVMRAAEMGVNAG